MFLYRRVRRLALDQNSSVVERIHGIARVGDVRVASPHTEVIHAVTRVARGIVAVRMQEPPTVGPAKRPIRDWDYEAEQVCCRRGGILADKRPGKRGIRGLEHSVARDSRHVAQIVGRLRNIRHSISNRRIRREERSRTEIHRRRPSIEHNLVRKFFLSNVSGHVADFGRQRINAVTNAARSGLNKIVMTRIAVPFQNIVKRAFVLGDGILKQQFHTYLSIRAIGEHVADIERERKPITRIVHGITERGDFRRIETASARGIGNGADACRARHNNGRSAVHPDCILERHAIDTPDKLARRRIYHLRPGGAPGIQPDML